MPETGRVGSVRLGRAPSSVATILLAAALATSAIACRPQAATRSAGDRAGRFDGSALDAAIAGSHRSTEARARDAYRHPRETLEFFGVAPEHTVVELWPGSGWYTDVLGPYLRDRGKLIVTNFDPEGPPESYRTTNAKALLAKLQDEALYGKVTVVTVGDGEPTLAPEGTVDVVLTFRNSHGWYEAGIQEGIYRAAFRALKPGGVFGVVQHRAPEGGDPKEWAPKGYLPEAEVIRAAKAVGFRLDAASEVNGNNKDSKDWPEGVWSLPPTLENAGDREAELRKVGESDRMTLRFVKPAS